MTEQCNYTVYNGTDATRCPLPEGHSGRHQPVMMTDVYPNGILASASGNVFTIPEPDPNVPPDHNC